MSWFQTIFENANLILLSCGLAWVILLLPALVYLGTTWRNRREFLFDRLGPDAIALYYKQFRPSFAPRRIPWRRRRSDQTDIKAQFRGDFGRFYGQRRYVLPLLLLALISGIGLLCTARSIQVW